MSWLLVLSGMIFIFFAWPAGSRWDRERKRVLAEGAGDAGRDPFWLWLCAGNCQIALGNYLDHYSHAAALFCFFAAGSLFFWWRSGGGPNGGPLRRIKGWGTKAVARLRAIRPPSRLPAPMPA